MKKFILKDRKMSIISTIFLMLAWELISILVDNEIIFPSIKSTMISLWGIVSSSDFLIVLKYSIFRSFIGFCISLSIAIILGVISTISKFAHNIMAPIKDFLSTVPVIAIIILALIWLSNEFTPIFVGFITTFPILYESVLKGVLTIDGDIIAMAKVYKVGAITIIKDIYIPSILLNLRLILSSVIGINLKMVIAGEVLSQPKYAIGTSLQLEKMYLNTSGVFAWIIIIMFVAKVFEYMWKGFAYYVWDKKYYQVL